MRRVFKIISEIGIRSFLWKGLRHIFLPIWKIFVYQGRLDSLDNFIHRKKIFSRFNQYLMENGYTPPWIITRQECLDFWRRITNDREFTGNRPNAYATKSPGIVQFLDQFWASHINQKNSILELGCNCGANLNHLRNMGYSALSGVEINETAIEQMRLCFPDLIKNTTISIGSLEELLPELPSNSVDVVFTMAVLMHIHPTANSIFREMIRVAKRFICTLELESANCSYVFARNYRRVFTRLGCSQLKSALITREAFPFVDKGYDGYISRLFVVQK